MGSMLNKVVEISAISPSSLRVVFDDGVVGVHDCAGLLDVEGPLVAPLRDPGFFSRVRLEYGAPTWPNGYDMCPDWLRAEMEAADELASVATE